MTRVYFIIYDTPGARRGRGCESGKCVGLRRSHLSTFLRVGTAIFRRSAVTVQEQSHLRVCRQGGFGDREGLDSAATGAVEIA